LARVDIYYNSKDHLVLEVCETTNPKVINLGINQEDIDRIISKICEVAKIFLGEGAVGKLKLQLKLLSGIRSYTYRGITINIIDRKP